MQFMRDMAESHLRVWGVPIPEKLNDFPVALPRFPVAGVGAGARAGKRTKSEAASAARPIVSSVSVQTDSEQDSEREGSVEVLFGKVETF